MDIDKEWLRHAIAVAMDGVAGGSAPFAGLVVADGRIIATGLNRVRQDVDPTAHAEIVAIRDACRNTKHPSLVGATLYASGEPCSMCMVAAGWAGVRRVVYAATAESAAAAGFDYVGSRRMLTPYSLWPLEVVHLPIENAHMPFDAWHADRLRSS